MKYSKFVNIYLRYNNIVVTVVMTMFCECDEGLQNLIVDPLYIGTFIVMEY